MYFTPFAQSEVGMGLCYRLDLSNCLSNPTEATEIFLFRKFQICIGEEPASYLMGKWESFPKGKSSDKFSQSLTSPRSFLRINGTTNLPHPLPRRRIT